MALVIPPLKTSLRQLTMLLTLSMGILLIPGLSQSDLSSSELIAPGRGPLFLLLARGLLRTRRLLLIIPGFMCFTSLPSLLSRSSLRLPTACPA